jgi:hypothetical protein
LMTSEVLHMYSSLAVLNAMQWVTPRQAHTHTRMHAQIPASRCAPRRGRPPSTPGTRSQAHHINPSGCEGGREAVCPYHRHHHRHRRCHIPSHLPPGPCPAPAPCLGSRIRRRRLRLEGPDEAHRHRHAANRPVYAHDPNHDLRGVALDPQAHMSLADNLRNDAEEEVGHAPGGGDGGGMAAVMAHRHRVPIRRRRWGLVRVWGEGGRGRQEGPAARRACAAEVVAMRGVLRLWQQLLCEDKQL